MSKNSLDWHTLSTGTEHLKTLCNEFNAKNTAFSPESNGTGRLLIDVSSDRVQFKDALSCSGESEGEDCKLRLNTKISLLGEDQESDDQVFNIDADYTGLWLVHKEIAEKASENERCREELINFFVYQLYTSVKRHLENQLEHFGISFPGTGLPSSLPPEDEFTSAVESDE